MNDFDNTPSIRRTHVTADEEQRIQKSVLNLGSELLWFDLATVMNRLEPMLPSDRMPSDQWVRIWLKSSDLVEEADGRTRPLKYRLSDKGRAAADKPESPNFSSGAIVGGVSAHRVSSAGAVRVPLSDESVVGGIGQGEAAGVAVHELPGPSVLLVLTPAQYDRIRPALALL